MADVPRLAQVCKHNPCGRVQQQPKRRQAALRLLRALHPQL
jgi:hypothetical protein